MTYTEEEFEEDLSNLYKKGLINVEYNEDLEATISLTDKGKLYADVMKDMYLD